MDRWRLRHTIQRRDIYSWFLKNADEVIISSTSAEVMPVIKVDGDDIGNGKVGDVTRKLQEGFNKYIKSHSI